MLARELRAAWKLPRGRRAALVGVELISLAVTGVLGAVMGFAAMAPLTVSAFRGLDRMIYGAEATSSELTKIPPAFFFLLALGLVLVGAAASLLGVGLRSADLSALRGRRPRAKMLFPLDRFGAAVLMNLLRAALIGLGTLLLVVPGVVALYRYAMASYLLAAHPELGPVEALRRSAKRMRYRKRDLFRLQLPCLLAMLICALPLLSARLVARSPLWTLLFALVSAAADLFLIAHLRLATTLYFQKIDRKPRKRSAA